MKKFSLVLAILMVFVGFAIPASAGPIYSGDPVCIPGDWNSVQIHEDTIWDAQHNLTSLDLYVKSGDLFYGTGFTGLTNSWTATSDGVHANASGTASGPFDFRLMFTDNTMASSMYYIVRGENASPTADEKALFGDNFLGYGLLTLNSGGYFAFNQLSVTTNGFTPVPEPASMLLLGTGLFGLAGAAKRRFRKS